MKSIIIRLCFLLFIICVSCKTKTKSSATTATTITTTFQKHKEYNFNTFTLLNLEYALSEISGLSFANGYIYTHNDEEGKLFTVNTENGETVTTYTFGKDDDYEGVEIIGDEAVLVKSNGDLLFYNFVSKEAKIIKNEFKKHHNIEGLGLIDNHLLVACKGQMLEDDGKNKKKGIYSFNLKTNELNTTPFLVVKDKILKEYVEETYADVEMSKKYKKKLLNRAVDFAPSGIAVHPKTKDIYMTSAKGSLLVIFNASKELKDVLFLDEKQLPQPEGICFDDALNLYISTEGKGNGGRIYKYFYTK